ncbi:MAG: ABC transporter substrate-binding protein [Chloroflexota bacterium]
MLKRGHLTTFSLLAALVILLTACRSEGDYLTPVPTRAAPTATRVATATPTPVAVVTHKPPTPAIITPTPTPVREETTRDVKIGFAFALSGDSADTGASQKAAAQMALEEINAAGRGPKLVGIFEDTAGDPDNALTRFQKMINIDKVDAIIGPTLSNEARSADSEAQKSKVPVLAVSNTASGITDIGDYIFRDSLAEFDVIPATIKMAKEKLNVDKVSLLYARDDAFSKSAADVFRTELQRNSIEILSEQTFLTLDTGFEPLLQAVKVEEPDAIVVSALAKPAQMILQQARNEVGIDPTVQIIGGSGFSSPSVIAAAGPAAEGLVIGTAWSPNAPGETSEKFVANYNKRTGNNPDQVAAQAYAGVHIMYDAIVRAGVSGKSLADTRTAIRDALNNTNDVETVLGSFSFTDQRDADHPPVIQIVKDGKLEVVK